MEANSSTEILTDGDLSQRGTDSVASEREKVISNFVRLHPMCNLSSIRVETLQNLLNSTELKHPRVDDLQVVTKSYEDRYFRRAKKENGERSCILEDKCLANVIARLRFGEKNDVGFVCREFMLPDVEENWRVGNGLPTIRGKCLICIRYFTTYCYIMTRQNHEFKTLVSSINSRKASNPKDVGCLQCSSTDMSPTTFSDSLCDNHINQQVLPTHCNPVYVEGGYCRSAMLFVDEGFANNQACRESRLGSLMWHPFVRFESRHYRYVRSSNEQEWEIVQDGVSSFHDHLNDLALPITAGTVARQVKA